MTKRLMLDKFGKISYCTSSDENVGKGCCIHLKGFQVDVNRIDEFKKQNKDLMDELFRKSMKENSKIKEEIPSEIYNKSFEFLEHHNMGICIAPTGIGKSSIINALSYDYRDSNPIIIVPTDNLESQYREYGSRATIITYKSIEDLDKIFSEKINKEDMKFVVFDECHRTMADEWLKASEEIINNVNKNGGKVIGFTATPFRTDNKDCRDIFNTTICEYSIEEAIEKHCYTNVPEYVTPVIDDEIINDFNKLIKETKLVTRNCNLDKLKKLRIELEEIVSMFPSPSEERNKIIMNSVDRTMERNKKDNKGVKLIVFARNNAELKSYKKEYDKLFKDKYSDKYNPIISTAKDDSPEEAKKFREKPVEQGKVSVLFSVEKYNEGFHINDLDIAVKTRKTSSERVDKQQNGRLFGNRKERGIIIDLCSNFRRSNNPTDWNRIDKITREDSYYGYSTLEDNAAKIYKLYENYKKEIEHALGR